MPPPHSKDPCAWVPSRQSLFHDYLNVATLFVLGATGLLQCLRGGWSYLTSLHAKELNDALSYALLAYMACDFVWIAKEGTRVVKTPHSITIHHVLICVMVGDALWTPSHHYYTALLVPLELNTVLLISRRLVDFNALGHSLFYLSWVYFRLIHFPVFAIYSAPSAVARHLPTGPSFLPSRDAHDPNLVSWLSLLVIIYLQCDWSFALVCSWLRARAGHTFTAANKADKYL